MDTPKGSKASFEVNDNEDVLVNPADLVAITLDASENLQAADTTKRVANRDNRRDDPSITDSHLGLSPCALEYELAEDSSNEIRKGCKKQDLTDAEKESTEGTPIAYSDANGEHSDGSVSEEGEDRPSNTEAPSNSAAAVSSGPVVEIDQEVPNRIITEILESDEEPDFEDTDVQDGRESHLKSSNNAQEVSKTAISPKELLRAQPITEIPDSEDELEADLDMIPDQVILEGQLSNGMPGIIESNVASQARSRNEILFTPSATELPSTTEKSRTEQVLSHTENVSVATPPAIHMNRTVLKDSSDSSNELVKFTTSVKNNESPAEPMRMSTSEFTATNGEPFAIAAQIPEPEPLPLTLEEKRLKTIQARHTAATASLADLQAKRLALLRSFSAQLSPHVSRSIPSAQPLSSSPYPPPIIAHSSRSQRTIAAEDDEKIMAEAKKTIKEHIQRLHTYNEIRDVGQGLIGMIADQRGVRIVDCQDEFGVGAGD